MFETPPAGYPTMVAPPRLESVHLREANARDSSGIARLGTYVFALTFGHSIPAHDLQAYLDLSYSIRATTQDIADPHKDMIVATTTSDNDGVGADGIAGFALLTRGTSEPCLAKYDGAVELQRLYIHPDSHGQGIGKMLARAEDMAKEQGFKAIWLGVWEENFKAQKVYESLGYEKIGEHDFEMGECVQTDFIIVKRLN